MTTKDVNQHSIITATLNILILVMHMATSSVKLYTTTPQIEVFRGIDKAVLECRYHTPSDDSIISFNWYRKTVTDKKFREIAQIPNNRSPVIIDRYLSRTAKVTYNRTNNLAVVRLEISDIQCNDEGEYQCGLMLYGKQSPENPNMRIIVYERPTKPKVTQSPKFLTENLNARFDCKGYTGKPKGRMRWIMYKRVRGRLKEVHMAGMTKRSQISTYCDMTGVVEKRLELLVSRSDITIECSILQPSINGHKPYMTQDTKKLNVRYPVDDVSIHISVNGKVLSRRKSVTASVGDMLLFGCASSGSPKPKYMWRFLPFSSQKLGSLRLDKGYSNSRLRLTNITTNHSGSYICVASNFVDFNEYSKTNVLKLHIKERLQTERSSTVSSTTISKRVVFPDTVIHYIMIAGIVGSTCICVLFLSLMFAQCSRRIIKRPTTQSYQVVLDTTPHSLPIKVCQ